MYGGSFDPVHRGHLALARTAVSQFNLSPLFIVPAYHPPHKEKTRAPFAHRLAMARLAFAGLPEIVITDLEKQRGGISYTVDSVAYLRERHPGGEFYLLIGVDTAAEIGTWKAPRRLARMARLLIAPRPGYHIDLEDYWRWDEVEMEPVEVAATEIRQAVRAGNPLVEYVPAAVAEYIARHKLYRRQVRP